MIIFDIETSGLTPSDCVVRCYAALDEASGDVEVRITSNDEGEKRLLLALRDLLLKYETWCGWNIEEFDVWFVAERCKTLGIDFPKTYPSGKKGKYGRDRYSVEGVELFDLAYELEGKASDLAVEWRLQSLAEAYGWRPSTDLDGEQMPGAVPAAVAAHCLDDIDACRFLSDSLGREASFADAQAEWLEGNLG
jgi:DNA polymerase elongation subunit (family B)